MSNKDKGHKFHSIWTSCIDLPGYNKRNWGYLLTMMNIAVKSRNDEMQDFVLFLANLYAQTHK